MGSIAKDTLTYIKTFVKDKKVASVTPSSPFLVRRVCQYIDFNVPSVVVEYGPGMGVFSEYILDRLPEGSHLILIETNESFCYELEKLEGDAKISIFNRSAEEVEDILEEAGEPNADYIISGIPFSFFDDVTRHELIQRTRHVLSTGGKFLVYQHYNHMDDPLRDHFPVVNKDFELLNIPPIHIHEAINQ